MNKTFKYRFSLVILLSLLFISCGNQDNQNKQNPELTELTIYCDEAIFDFMSVPFAKFDSTFSQYKLTRIKATAFQSMAKFLHGDVKAAIISRNYTRREDSLLKVNNITIHQQIPMAYDALVFYVHHDSKLDTLNDFQIKALLTNKGAQLKNDLKYIASEPVLVTNSNQSSEYENLKALVLKNKSLDHQVKLMSSSDSVKKYILSHPNDIGIGYLSQIINNPDLKPLRISFNDSTGKYIFPHVVHQANIVQNLYPYKVTHYIYLFDNQTDLATKFSMFFSKRGIVQMYFNNAGIVPAYAEIRLVPTNE